MIIAVASRKFRIIFLHFYKRALRASYYLAGLSCANAAPNSYALAGMVGLVIATASRRRGNRRRPP